LRKKEKTNGPTLQKGEREVRKKIMGKKSVARKGKTEPPQKTYCAKNINRD